MSLKCPVCNLELVLQSNSYTCNNNHVFDISKYGYVNLLMVNKKRSKIPGDSEEMIKSRNAFLNKGYYGCLSEKINQLIYKSISKKEENILDIGCAVGYYLWELRNNFNGDNHLNLYGIDISKSAVQIASKRKIPNSKLAVASAYNLPFLDEIFDIAYCIFSPISINENERVLKKDGILIIVGPGEEHLSGLTKYIYDSFVPHGGNNILNDSNSFELVESFEIKQSVKVLQEDILDLIKMTPYYWKMSEEQLQKVNNLEILQTVIHFEIKKYKKRD